MHTTHRGFNAGLAYPFAALGPNTDSIPLGGAHERPVVDTSIYGFLLLILVYIIDGRCPISPF